MHDVTGWRTTRGVGHLPQSALVRGDVFAIRAGRASSPLGGNPRGASNVLKTKAPRPSLGFTQGSPTRWAAEQATTPRAEEMYRWPRCAQHTFILVILVCRPVTRLC